MPLFIRSLNMTCMKQTMNLMVAISHNKEKNQIEIRGRMRYENSDHKQTFEKNPVAYTKENYKLAEEYIRDFMDTMIDKNMPFEMLTPPQEVKFETNDTMEQIMKKMNDCNMFNIGTHQMPWDKNAQIVMNSNGQ